MAMTTTAAAPMSGAGDSDRPRTIVRTVAKADRTFRTVCASAAMLSLVIIGSTALFLTWNAAPVLGKVGIWSFLSQSVWSPGVDIARLEYNAHDIFLEEREPCFWLAIKASGTG